jgi:hypothetical protein
MVSPCSLKRFQPRGPTGRLLRRLTKEALLKSTARVGVRSKKCPHGEERARFKPSDVGALRSCMKVKFRIDALFQSSAPPHTLRAARFRLIFQGLGCCVKRCCSITGLLLPSECVGRRWLFDTPSRWPRLFPFAADRRVFPAKVIISNQRAGGTQMSSPGQTRLAPSPERFSRNATGRPDACTPALFRIFLSGRVFHTSDLAPNERLPVTWLQHPPIKIIA